MAKILPSLDALSVFEAAARLGSFKAAAQALSVSPTAVSHRIRALEETLGCLLFVRQVRAVTLTAEGRVLQAAVAEGMAGIARAVGHIRNGGRTSVTVSVTPEFAAKWLVPKLADFQTACPGIDLHVHASYQTADLNGGAADLAVRYGSGAFAGVKAVPLFRERFAPVAAPGLARTLPADAAQWPLIHLNWHRPQTGAFDWAVWARSAGIAPQKMQAGIRYSDATHAVQAAVAGQGVALPGLLLLAEELRLNLLEIVAEPVLPGQFYWVCTPEKRPLSAAAQAVKNLLLNAAESGGLP